MLTLMRLGTPPQESLRLIQLLSIIKISSKMVEVNKGPSPTEILEVACKAWLSLEDWFSLMVLLHPYNQKERR